MVFANEDFDRIPKAKPMMLQNGVKNHYVMTRIASAFSIMLSKPVRKHYVGTEYFHYKQTICVKPIMLKIKPVSHC